MVLLEELGRGEQVGSPRGTRRAEGAEETQPSEKTGKEEEWGVIPGGETLRKEGSPRVVQRSRMANTHVLLWT